MCCCADLRAGRELHPPGPAYSISDTEVVMLLEAWYTVLAYPPQCKALLETADSAQLKTILMAGASIAQDDASMVQLTLAAIAAQLSRVQLHLKAGGCMSSSPAPLGGAGGLAYSNWLNVFHQDYIRKSQVEHA